MDNDFDFYNSGVNLPAWLRVGHVIAQPFINFPGIVIFIDPVNLSVCCYDHGESEIREYDLLDVCLESCDFSGGIDEDDVREDINRDDVKSFIYRRTCSLIHKRIMAE